MTEDEWNEFYKELKEKESKRGPSNPPFPFFPVYPPFRREDEDCGLWGKKANIPAKTITVTSPPPCYDARLYKACRDYVEWYEKYSPTDPSFRSIFSMVWDVLRTEFKRVDKK